MQETNTNEGASGPAISWGSIAGGVVTVLAVSILLGLLSIAAGLGMMWPLPDSETAMIGSFGLWATLMLIISFATGGFIAGSLARKNGSIHGLLVWAISLTCTFLLGNFMAGSAVSAATGVIVSAIKDAGTTTEITITSLSNDGTALINRIADDLNADMNLDFETGQNAIVKQWLLATGIPVMYPDFIKSQMENARDDADQALQKLRADPDHYVTILSDLTARLDQRMDAISEEIDPNAALRGLIKNAGMSENTAKITLTRLMAEHQQNVSLAQNILSQAQGRLHAAQLQIDDIIQSAQDTADAVSRIVMRSAFAAFFALLVGAILCSYAGYFGAIWHVDWLRRDKITISRDNPP